MELEITENGTQAFYLREGLHRFEISGTLGGSTNVALKTGPSSDGSDHVAATEPDGTTAIAYTNASTPEPRVLQGGGYYSLVTTTYSGSSNVKAHFRKAAASAM